MNDAVTRLMALADQFAGSYRIYGPQDAPVLSSRQALQDELQKLFTPLSDDQIEEGVKAWFETSIASGQYQFSRRMRAAINAAHGIGETQ